MNPREAESLIGDLLRRYPGRDLSDSSVDIFVRTALGFEVEEGRRAVERAARYSPMFMPSWGQWEQALLAESHDRRDGERAARRLPPGGEPLLSRAEIARRWGELRKRLADFGKVPAIADVPGEEEKPRSYEEPVIVTPGEGDFCSCGGTYNEHHRCRLCGAEIKEPAVSSTMKGGKV